MNRFYQNIFTLELAAAIGVTFGLAALNVACGVVQEGDAQGEEILDYRPLETAGEEMPAAAPQPAEISPKDCIIGRTDVVAYR